MIQVFKLDYSAGHDDQDKRHLMWQPSVAIIERLDACSLPFQADWRYPFEYQANWSAERGQIPWAFIVYPQPLTIPGYVAQLRGAPDNLAMLDFRCTRAADGGARSRRQSAPSWLSTETAAHKHLIKPMASRTFSALVVPRRGVLQILGRQSLLLKDIWRAMDDVDEEPCWICFAELPPADFITHWTAQNQQICDVIERRLEPPPEFELAPQVDQQHRMNALIALEASRMGHHEMARPLLEKALCLEKKSASLWNAIGQSRAATDEYGGAATAYLQAIFLAPDWLPPMHALREIWFKEGNWEALLWLCPRILRCDPLHDETLFALGVARHRLGDPSGALGPLQNAADLCPRWKRAWEELGFLYQDLRDYSSAARAMYRNLMSEDAGAADFNNYGHMLAQTGDLDGAEKYVASALEHAPNNPAYLDSMGYVLLRRNRVDEAILYFELAVDENPRDFEAWNHLALCYARQREWLPARKALQLASAAQAENRKDDPRQACLIPLDCCNP